MHNILRISITDNVLVNILVLGLLSFILSILLTPIYTTLAYKYEWWKKQRTDALSGERAVVYDKIHAQKHRKKIPNMAGIIFVVSIGVITFLLNLKRSQTLLPLAGLIGAGIIGFIDDFMNIKGLNSRFAGMQAKLKFMLYSLLSIGGGIWFFAKLGVHTIYLPYFHNVNVGVFIVLIFWLVVIATANSVNITDGLDGLAGGLLTSSFIAYAIICGVEHKFFLASFCITVVGALLSYTWFNIYPARFFMGDVGSFALGTALGIIAMQTNTIYVLPLIGLVYVFETGSVIINIISKKLRNGKKVFLSSPIHHHFEAIGWPETKVTMRFWILGQAATFIGLIVFLISKW